MVQVIIKAPIVCFPTTPICLKQLPVKKKARFFRVLGLGFKTL